MWVLWDSGNFHCVNNNIWGRGIVIVQKSIAPPHYCLSYLFYVSEVTDLSIKNGLL